MVPSIAMYHNNLIKLQSFVYTQFNDETVLLPTIQFRINHCIANSFIWPIDSTLLCATTPGQSEPGNDGNEGVFHIPQISKTESSIYIYIYIYIEREREG